MDRFKFRAWDVELQGMSDSFTIQDLAYANMAGITPRFGTDNYILMQCTGLKDKHGKLIYEGDILDLQHEYDEQSGFVVGDSADGFFDDVSYLGCFNQPEIEIIGNIYENPELLDDKHHI